MLISEIVSHQFPPTFFNYILFELVNYCFCVSIAAIFYKLKLIKFSHFLLGRLCFYPFYSITFCLIHYSLMINLVIQLKLASLKIRFKQFKSEFNSLKFKIIWIGCIFINFSFSQYHFNLQ